MPPNQKVEVKMSKINPMFINGKAICQNGCNCTRKHIGAFCLPWYVERISTLEDEVKQLVKLAEREQKVRILDIKGGGQAYEVVECSGCAPTKAALKKVREWASLPPGLLTDGWAQSYAVKARKEVLAVLDHVES